MVGNGPSCSTVSVGVTMPSYFPVPATRILVSFPSAVNSSVSRLSPSASIDSHTLLDLIFPSNEEYSPTQRKMCQTGLRVIALATPDQQAVKS